MEKTPMYAVVTPPRPRKFQKVAWAALAIGLVALIVASVTAYVERREMERVNALEDTVLQMQLHMEQLLQFTHDFLEYEDDLEDPQEGGAYEELTVRGVVRKKRQAPDGRRGVPIYEEAYGVDISNRFNSEGLRLYESFVDGQSDLGSDQSPETTESPIKPHHRAELDDDYEDDQASVVSTRQGVVGGRRPSQIIQRTSRVKSTAPNSGFSTPGFNSVVPQRSSPPGAIVVPQGPTRVHQGPQQLKQGLAELVQKPFPRKKPEGSKKRKPGRGRRRRGIRPTITLGHFVAAPANRTAHHVTDGVVHDEWTPAAWMDKLGLNKKYTLRRGTVNVKESGLYYLYAQVLYEPGRFGTGFQIMVDGIPVMECSLTPSQPSHSCHTSGTTYLPRNAAVYIRDNESHMKAVRREENSFFGLIKLMDAPKSAEKLILG